MHQPFLWIVPSDLEAGRRNAGDPEVARSAAWLLAVGDKLEDFALFRLAHLVLSKHPQMVNSPRPQARDDSLSHWAWKDALLALWKPVLRVLLPLDHDALDSGGHVLYCP